MSGKHAVVTPVVSVSAAAAVAAAAAAVPAALAGTVAPAVPAAHEVTAGLDARVVRQVPRARPLVTRIVSASAQKSYTVAAGDTLSGIAGRFCGNPGAWPSLQAGNQAEVPDPDLIYPGTRLRLTCDQLAAAVQAPADADGVPPAAAPAAAAITGASGTVSAAGMSAFEQCVISRESGGQAQVMNASGHYGLFQFSKSTWLAYGGSASSFGNASVAQQEAVFNAAMATPGGASNWTPYDGCVLG